MPFSLRTHMEIKPIMETILNTDADADTDTDADADENADADLDMDVDTVSVKEPDVDVDDHQLHPLHSIVGLTEIARMEANNVHTLPT